MAIPSNPTELYIDLIKKAVAFSLWAEPPMPIENLSYMMPFHRKLLVRTLAGVFRLVGLQVVRDRKIDTHRREQGNYWPLLAHTMLGTKRLDNIQFCMESVIKDGVEGDLLEAGVWRGGACILMRAILAAYGITDRRVFVADSFMGLPEPDDAHYSQDEGDMHHSFDYLAVTQEQVKENFRKYGLLDEQVIFLEGWFKDTLPNAPVEKLAIMRLDGDMYESTMDGLVPLYDRLSDGGYCLIDDYALGPCKAAVDDFRTERGIKDPIQKIDYTGIYWRKNA